MVAWNQEAVLDYTPTGEMKLPINRPRIVAKDIGFVVHVRYGRNKGTNVARGV